jgi:hypothetical protein
MQITAPLPPIPPAWLAAVTGGCHKHCCAQPQPQPQPPPQEAAPQSQTLPQQAAPSDPLVQTNVSISYR